MYGYLLAAWLGMCEHFTEPCAELGYDSLYQFALPAALSCLHPPPLTPHPHAC